MQTPIPPWFTYALCALVLTLLLCLFLLPTVAQPISQLAPRVRLVFPPL